MISWLNAACCDKQPVIINVGHQRDDLPHGKSATSIGNGKLKRNTSNCVHVHCQCVRACVRACVCVCARAGVCVCVLCVVCCYALPILSQQQCAPCTQKPVGVTGVMEPPTSQIGKSKIANEIDKYTRLTQLAVRFLLQCSFKLVEQCSTCLKASQQMKPLSFFKTPSSGI